MFLNRPQFHFILEIAVFQNENMNLRVQSIHRHPSTSVSLQIEPATGSSGDQTASTDVPAILVPIPSADKATFILSLDETYDFRRSKFLDNESVITSGIITLPSLTKIPPVLAWTSIPYNVHEDDGKFLTNIPFLGDEVIDKDKKFIDEMVNLYEGKVHGIGDTGKRIRMDNDVFYGLVQALMDLENRNGSNIFIEESKDVAGSSPKRSKDINYEMKKESCQVKLEADVTQLESNRIPSNVVLTAISTTFQGIGTNDELRER
jgi:hypothetical protein